MLREHDDGRFAVLVSDQGSVHLDVSPRGSQVELIQMVERLRRFEAGSVFQRTAAPLSADRVPEGPYLIRLHAAGYEPLTAPLHVVAGRCTRMRLRLLRAGTVPADYCHVPAGTFRFGSPRSAHEPPGEHALPDFLMARTPVTNQQYASFLESIARRDPKEADRRSPRAHDGRTPAWTRVGGRFPIPEAQGWRADAPVVGIRFNDAAAFCRWLSQQAGTTCRLPTEEEWEKAARGTEGLPFSWGHVWEPAYAAGPETWPESLPPPVGLVEADCSAYGMRDAVGGVREWTGTVIRGAERRVAVRGGSFRTGGSMGRPLWRRELVHADAVAVDIGFRVLREL
jgi:formylglycine-generating enzyme required for sulfatase activity